MSRCSRSSVCGRSCAGIARAALRHRHGPPRRGRSRSVSRRRHGSRRHGSRRHRRRRRRQEPVGLRLRGRPRLAESGALQAARPRGPLLREEGALPPPRSGPRTTRMLRARTPRTTRRARARSGATSAATGCWRRRSGRRPSSRSTRATRRARTHHSAASASVSSSAAARHPSGRCTTTATAPTTDRTRRACRASTSCSCCWTASPSEVRPTDSSSRPGSPIPSAASRAATGYGRRTPASRRVSRWRRWTCRDSQR